MRNYLKNIVLLSISIFIYSCNDPQRLTGMELAQKRRDSINMEVQLRSEFHNRMTKFIGQLKIGYLPLFNEADYILRIWFLNFHDPIVKHILVCNVTKDKTHISYNKVESRRENDTEVLLSNNYFSLVPKNGEENFRGELNAIGIDSLLSIKTNYKDQKYSFDGVGCCIEIYKIGEYKRFGYKIPIGQEELTNIQIRKTKRLLDFLYHEFPQLHIE